MDVINFISKAPGLPNATVSDPSSKYQHGCEHYANGPRLHKYLQQIGSLMNEYNVFSVGEMPWVNEPEEIIKSVGFDRAELNMIFNFDIVDMDHGSKGKFSPKQWSMSDLKAITNKWQSFMHQNDGWNALYLENHDQSRTVSRWGSDKPKFRNVAARMFATFLGLQSGTPFLYQGQELGMSNIPEDWEMTEYRDLETLNHWKKIIASHADDVHLLETTKQQYRLKSRDNARTPMQWDSSVHAGFTTGKPWMHVNNNYPTCNAAAQVGDPTSVFEHWAHILRLRKDHRDVLVYGNFSLVDAQNEDVFAYTRRFGEQTILVVANFREGEARWTMPERVDVKEELLLVSNYPDLRVEGREIVLRPFEAFACRRGSIRAQRL
ncbi:hypothetical protein LTR60_000332 [Cryomyces antarcticus]|nr:hypothetical protein LTR60_000332 [Cryomyces antarcticus]